MGADGNKKTGYGTKGRTALQTQFIEGVEAGPEQAGKALAVVQEFIDETTSKDPSRERAKLSVANLADGQWVASVVDWPGRRAVTAFSWSVPQAIYKLGERLCEGGDLWRPMKEK